MRPNDATKGETSVFLKTWHLGNETEALLKNVVELKCLLCRGTMNGKTITEVARQYLNKDEKLFPWVLLF